MGRCVASHAVSEVSVVSLAAPLAGKWCLWGCNAHCRWEEHRGTPTGAGCGPNPHLPVEATVCCCSQIYKAVDHQIFQYVLWKSVCTHTNGPWKRASSGRHEHNILPVCFIQQADLPLRGKCLLPLRHFLSVAIPFFNRKMEGLFSPFFPNICILLSLP